MSERNDPGGAVANDWLERILTEDGREHRADYLADGGFTERVAAALPVPATLPAWRKPVLALLWTIAAVGVALALPGAVAEVAATVVRLFGHQPISLGGIAVGLVALATASWAGAAYALRGDD